MLLLLQVVWKPVMLPPSPAPAQIQPQLTLTRHSLLLAGREHGAEVLVRGTLILARGEPEDRHPLWGFRRDGLAWSMQALQPDENVSSLSNFNSITLYMGHLKQKCQEKTKKADKFF